MKVMMTKPMKTLSRYIDDIPLSNTATGLC
jgi:hypothetical protein